MTFHELYGRLDYTLSRLNRAKFVTGAGIIHFAVCDQRKVFEILKFDRLTTKPRNLLVDPAHCDNNNNDDDLFIFCPAGRGRRRRAAFTFLG